MSSKWYLNGIASAIMLLVIFHGLSEATDTPDRKENAEIAKRFAVMKKNARTLSITIYPIIMEGKPFYKVGATVAVMFEQMGLKEIDVANDEFVPDTTDDIGEIRDSFSEFISKKSMDTDYVLFGEYVGTPQAGVEEVRCIIVDREGNPVWVDSQTPEDEDFKRIQPKNPMLCTYLLADRLRTALELPEPGEDAPEGKWAEYWRKDGGLPPKNEISDMEKRCAAMRDILKNSSVLIFPVRIADGVNTEHAGNLAELLNRQKICRARAAADKINFSIELTDNKQKMIWNLANQFRTHVRKNKIDEDYTLYCDYHLDESEGSVHGVFFVLCDSHGEWVIVDYQFRFHPDFKNISPKSASGCNRLVVKRLEGYVAGLWIW